MLKFDSQIRNVVLFSGLKNRKIKRNLRFAPIRGIYFGLNKRVTGSIKNIYRMND
jgi:hypothetical protein